MGYYTYYTLVAERLPGYPIEDSVTEAEIRKEVDRLDVFEYEDRDDLRWEGHAKWYDFERDMLLLSSKFPEHLFTLHGDGEESDDFWREYFYDGRSQFTQAEIVYEEFSFSKLKTPKDPVLSTEAARRMLNEDKT